MNKKERGNLFKKIDPNNFFELNYLYEIWVLQSGIDDENIENIENIASIFLKIINPKAETETEIESANASENEKYPQIYQFLKNYKTRTTGVWNYESITCFLEIINELSKNQPITSWCHVAQLLTLKGFGDFTFKSCKNFFYRNQLYDLRRTHQRHFKNYSCLVDDNLPLEIFNTRFKEYLCIFLKRKIADDKIVDDDKIVAFGVGADDSGDSFIDILLKPNIDTKNMKQEYIFHLDGIHDEIIRIKYNSCDGPAIKF